MKRRCFNTLSSLDSQCNNLSKHCKWTAERWAAPQSWRRAVRRFSWSWRRSDSFGCRILSWLPSHPETEWHPEVEVSTWKWVKGARLVQKSLNTTAIYKKVPDSPPPAEGTEALRGQWSPTIPEFLWHCGGLCTEVALTWLFYVVLEVQSAALLNFRELDRKTKNCNNLLSPLLNSVTVCDGNQWGASQKILSCFFPNSP